MRFWLKWSLFVEAYLRNGWRYGAANLKFGLGWKSSFITVLARNRYLIILTPSPLKSTSKLNRPKIAKKSPKSVVSSSSHISGTANATANLIWYLDSPWVALQHRVRTDFWYLDSFTPKNDVKVGQYSKKCYFRWKWMSVYWCSAGSTPVMGEWTPLEVQGRVQEGWKRSWIINEVMNN